MAIQGGTGKQTKLEPGVWEGEYLDVRGLRGKVRFVLRSVDKAVSGEFEMSLVTRGRPLVHKGSLEGSVDGTNVRLTLKGPAQVLEHVAEVREAGSYAKQALIGVVRTSPGADWGGGVWIAWRFARD